MSKKNPNAVISRNKADINLDTTALDPNSTGKFGIFCLFFFQTMLENYTFLPFSVFLAIFWVFTYKKVPETKNKTFDEIATLFKIQNKQK